MFGPTRAVVLTTEALTGTIARLRRDFGTAASVILFDMGLAMGEQSADNALKYLGENQSKEFSEDFAKLYAAMGWGIATLVKSDHEEKKEILDLQNCFECEPFRNGDVRSNSQLVRGFVNGAANIAFAKPCYTREVDCIAKGDERCRFVTALP
jgi:predicted hydrocarbon binding protein